MNNTIRSVNAWDVRLPAGSTVYPVKTTGYRTWACKPVQLAEDVMVNFLDADAELILTQTQTLKGDLWAYYQFPSTIREEGMSRKSVFCGFVYYVEDVNYKKRKMFPLKRKH